DSFTGKKFYIATMIPYGDEAHTAIERHREMRRNKGFDTIEKYTDIDEIYLPKGYAALLECMGNLCANEMFKDEEITAPTEKIMSGIERLKAQVQHLVIVTNNVSCDGIAYSKETMEYMRIMADINRRMAEIADNVIECVYGIPVPLKGMLL
ncbi:MAG: bifunctional adenosylcobinamide kinase/adenosylcobinamide-phosphate guanylyltransferase, partial [Oscillospiraceae bacterium]|nr:bifunctional adenosylcobinamide kinase/adenosylcobinamide-phosphate guanylyltransferase [Oscillospiraceae bacterium]